MCAGWLFVFRAKLGRHSLCGSIRRLYVCNLITDRLACHLSVFERQILQIRQCHFTGGQHWTLIGTYLCGLVHQNLSSSQLNSGEGKFGPRNWERSGRNEWPWPACLWTLSLMSSLLSLETDPPPTPTQHGWPCGLDADERPVLTPCEIVSSCSDWEKRAAKVSSCMRSFRRKHVNDCCISLNVQFCGWKLRPGAEWLNEYTCLSDHMVEEILSCKKALPLRYVRQLRPTSIPQCWLSARAVCPSSVRRS